jgi:hypothetical protein
MKTHQSAGKTTAAIGLLFGAMWLLILVLWKGIDENWSIWLYVVVVPLYLGFFAIVYLYKTRYYADKNRRE